MNEDTTEQPAYEPPSEPSEPAPSSDTPAAADAMPGDTASDAPAPLATDTFQPPARMPGAYAASVPPALDAAPEPVAPVETAAEPEMAAPPPPPPTTAWTPAPAPQVAEPAAPAPPVIAPASMSGPASTDTQEWEVPPAAAIAGAAAASQWAQPAPAIPQPIVPAPVTPPPPAQTWQPAQPQQAPAAAPPPAQQWQQPQQAPPPAQQWQPTPVPPPPPAAQQTWQQQQPQQPWTQPQQQYQQPYGQPYGQPYAQPYGQPYAAQPPSGYNTSPLAIFAGLLLVVFGLGIIVLGIFTLGQGAALSQFIRDNDIKVFGTQLTRDLLRTVLTPSPAILMVMGALQLLCGIGVMAHKSWGRWLGFLLALLGLIVSIFAVSIAYALAGGFTVPVIIGVVLLVGYVLIVLTLLAGGSQFRRKVAPR